MFRNQLITGKWLIGSGLFFGILLGQASGQPDPILEIEKKFQAKFLTAATLAGEPNPYSRASILLKQRKDLWGILDEVVDEPFAGKFAPSLDPELLECLREMDGRPVPDLRKRAGTKAQLTFLALYAEALWNAKRVPTSAFALVAEENPGVTFGHLYDQPEKYWGKVVTIEGKLARVRRNETFFYAKKKGVMEFYDGWLFTPTARRHPLGVAFAHLPPGIKVAENLSPEPLVTVHGYFLGRVKFRSEDGKDRITPMLVCPTLILKTPPPAPPESPWSPVAYWAFYGVLGVICLVVVLVISLNLLYRKGDQDVRNRLAQIQAERTVQELEGSGPNSFRDEPKSGNGFVPDGDQKARPDDETGFTAS